MVQTSSLVPGRDDDLQVSDLVPHRSGVHLTRSIKGNVWRIPAEVAADLYLAHVRAAVRGLHLPEGEGPGVLVVVGDVQPRVVGDDMVVYCEDGLGVRFNPSNLQQPR